MWIKVCLNGGRSRQDHPAVPITPVELAAAARQAVDAGAQAVHVHPRDDREQETLSAQYIGAAVAAVRVAGVPIGVSTGLWISGGDPVARLRDISTWPRLPDSRRPDFASVNLSEPGYAELIATLMESGIGVEAGIWSIADVERLASTDLAPRCVRLLVEVIGGAATDAVSTASDILARMDELRIPGTRLLHGEDASTWPLIALAARLDLPTRIGLEDTTVGPEGHPVADNAALVTLAREISP